MAAAPPLPEQRRWLFIYTLFHGHRPAWPVIVGPPELPEKKRKRNPRPKETITPQEKTAPREKRNKGKTKEKVQSKGGPALHPPPHYLPPYPLGVLSLLLCIRLSSCAKTPVLHLLLSRPTAVSQWVCLGVSTRTPSRSLSTAFCAVAPTPGTW